MSRTVSASEARRTLFGLIDAANDDCEVVEIVGRRSRVFLVPEAEYRALAETEYLLRAPANARRLEKALLDAEHGRLVVVDVDATIDAASDSG